MSRRVRDSLQGWEAWAVQVTPRDSFDLLDGPFLAGRHMADAPKSVGDSHPPHYSGYRLATFETRRFAENAAKGIRYKPLYRSVKAVRVKVQVTVIPRVNTQRRST